MPALRASQSRLPSSHRSSGKTAISFSPPIRGGQTRAACAECRIAIESDDREALLEEVRQPTGRVGTNTISDYRGVIEGYLHPEFGEKPLESITPDAIDPYKERLIAKGKLSSRTITRHLTVLHGIFKRAKRVWKLADNPASAELVERPKLVYTGEFDRRLSKSPASSRSWHFHRRVD